MRRWPPLCVVNQIGFGHVASCVMNANRGKKSDKVWQPRDFFPTLRGDEAEGVEEDKLAIAADAFRGDALARWREERKAQAED